MWWLSLTPLRELNVPAYTEFPHVLGGNRVTGRTGVSVRKGIWL